MFLQQNRFGNCCLFEMQVEDGLDGFKLPSLVVQTLIENAVKHAIAPCAEGGRIQLQIASERGRPAGDAIRVEVVNTGKPLKEPVIELSAHQFLRIHRAFLVSIESVQKVVQRDGHWVELFDRTRLPLARRKISAVKERLKFR